MQKFLNWGDKTIFRYENGSIQDKALVRVCLFFLREPENMKKYLAENEVTLNTKQKTKILETIEQVEQENEAKVSRHFFDMLFSQVPSEDNGFKGVDYEKDVCNGFVFCT